MTDGMFCGLSTRTINTKLCRFRLCSVARVRRFFWAGPYCTLDVPNIACIPDERTLHVPNLACIDGGRYSWDYVLVFEVRAEDKELTNYQRRFSMKEILARFNAGGE